MLKRFLFTLALLLGMIAPLPVFAATNPYQSVPCGAVNDGNAVCAGKNNTTDPVTGKNGILIKVTDMIALVAGVAAVYFMVFAGIKYITAQGDAQEISKAKQTIIYAGVGLVAIVLARQVINYVLSNI